MAATGALAGRAPRPPTRPTPATSWPTSPSPRPWRGRQLRPAPGRQHRRSQLDAAEPEQPRGHPDRRAPSACATRSSCASRTARSSSSPPTSTAPTGASTTSTSTSGTPTDLRTFTGYRRMKMHYMATHSWAPEAFWDAGRGQYGDHLLRGNNGGHDVIMVNYTTRLRARVGARRSSSTPATTSSTATSSSAQRHQLPVLQEPHHGTLLGARSTTAATRAASRDLHQRALAAAASRRRRWSSR